MIRRLILTFCFAILTTGIFAQIPDSVYYFNHDGKIIADKNAADFYRVIHTLIDDRLTFTEHRKDGSWVDATANGPISNPVYDGAVIWYYPNGKHHEEHVYSNGRPSITLRYHQNGTLLQTIFYANMNVPYDRIMYEADSTGKQNIFNGKGSRIESGGVGLGGFAGEIYQKEGPYEGGIKSGKWKGTDDRGISFEEVYKNNKIVESTAKGPDGKKYSYTDIFEYRLSDEQSQEICNRIKKSLKNPADTLGLRMTGPANEFGFTIKASGDIIKVYGVKKSSTDRVYLAITKRIKTIPAKLRGVPIDYTVERGWSDIYNGRRVLPFGTSIFFTGQ